MSGRHVLHRDAETHSTLDLPDVGARRYAADPTTGVWCVSHAVDDAPTRIWIPGQPIPEEFHTAARDPDWLVIAHNDAFERAIEEFILAPRYGWPLAPIERHRCTMAMASASALPAALDKLAEVLKLPVRKDAVGTRLMRQMARPRKPRADEDPAGIFWHDEPDKLERLCTYCCIDTDVERAAYHKLSPLVDSEQALWVLDAVINRRGFYTDGALLEAASRIAAAAGIVVQEELARITAGALTSTNQVEAISTWLAEHGCEVKNLQKGTLKHALRRKELGPVVRRVIQLRLEAAHAAAAKIDTLRAWRNGDGRVCGTLRYHGAGTGRWTGHGPQPQNFKRDADGVDAKIAAIATGELAHVQERYPQPLEVVGDIARAMIRAAPGHHLLIGDFSGIESRVTAWVSGQQSKLDQWAKFDRTSDPKDEPYYLLGRSCGQPEESARKIGKTTDLAFGYMGGPAAWDRLAPEDDPSSDADKRRFQQTWRNLHPRTVRFWYDIDRAAIAAIRAPGKSFTYKRFTLAFNGTFLRITLPSGRALSYPFPRLETGKYGQPMVMFKDNAGGKWVDCRHGLGAYGGLWVENIVQAVSRDLLAGAMQRLESAGYRIVLTIHDEIVAEVPEGFGSLGEFQRLITAAPEWAQDLPIAAKVRTGERFSKPEKPPANAPSITPESRAGPAAIPSSTESETAAAGRDEDLPVDDKVTVAAPPISGLAGAIRDVQMFIAATASGCREQSAQSDEVLPWEGPATFGDTAVEASEPLRAPEPLRGNGHAADGFDGFPDKVPGGKILCPFHDDHSPSLHIYPGGDDPHFHCFVCGAHGRLDELEVDWEAALKSPVGASAGAPIDEDNERNLERAHELWDKAKPIAGTLAERYLAETRGIDVSALPASISEVLRFHPHCWFAVDKYHPALIALFRDVETGERAGIHRTWLTADAQKIDRRMFGRWSRPRAIKLWPADNRLFVAEGIETALAAATQLKMRPAWALGSKVYLKKLPVISGVDELTMLVDHDTDGEETAAACYQVWKAVGRRVRRLRTKDAGLNDFNDLILKTPRADWNSGFEEIKENFAEDSGANGAAPKTNSAGANGSAGPPSEVIEPVDLWGQFDPPFLPIGLLPDALERFAFEDADLTGADPSGIAVAALTVCAAALSDYTQLQVKKHDAHWLESARLWVGLIGNPSTKKTPIIQRAAKPLKRLDAELWRQYVAACECFDELSKEERKQAERPKQCRLRLEDTTIEAAQEVLKDSPDGVLCIQDELAGWFGAMDKYSGRGAAKDRGFWLQSFHGGPYALNRIARGAAMIENLSVSLLGGIQPEPIRKIADDTVDDGLLQRLIPIVLRRSSAGKDLPTGQAAQRYDHLIERLHRRERPVAPLRFNDTALAIREGLEERHLDLMACEIINRKLAAHIGKYDGLFARLCLLWHCIEDSDGLIITEHTARRVADFVHRFLLPHAVAFYAGILELSDEHDRLTKVAGYILARKLARITNRDVQRGNNAMRGLERQEIENLFDQLEALGWLTRTPGPLWSKPPHWQVNPEVHRRFAERAAREAAERAKEHEMLQEMFRGGDQ